MTTLLRRFLPALAVLLALTGLAGCETVVTSGLMAGGRLALEDRSAEDQLRDNQIALRLTGRMAETDHQLLIDLAVDVWEGRLMLTGALSDPAQRAKVLALAREDSRIKETLDDIQMVSAQVAAARRAERRTAEAETQTRDGAALGQTLNDMWIETKLKAQLMTAENLSSVNFRWRAVKGQVYLLGRAKDDAEKAKVLKITSETAGVTKVISHIRVGTRA